MYQFSTTNVINSNLDSNGTTAKFTGSTTALTMPRIGNFKKDNIVHVYKRAYSAGVKEVATVTVPALTAGQVARLSIDVRLEQSTNSEYASAYLHFSKPVDVEVIATGTATTDAAALKSAIEGLKDRFGTSYIKATVAGAVITITALDNNQRINSLKLYEEAASVNSIIDPQYDLKATGSVTTSGKLGFGDDEYMAKSVRMETLDNVRRDAIGADERPVLGGNYSQYTLRYKVAKSGDGIVAAGESITTHVFYVISGQVSAFETVLNADAGLDLDGDSKYTVVS